MQTLDSKSLSVQLVISLVGLALLTALMVGLPAIWLIRNQLESQAWAQVHQGVQATTALYAAREQDLDNLATLTAQRPSLRSLLQPVDREALTAYLETLRQGADLDWIAVCDTDGEAQSHRLSMERLARCRRAHAASIRPKLSRR